MWSMHKQKYASERETSTIRYLENEDASLSVFGDDASVQESLLYKRPPYTLDKLATDKQSSMLYACFYNTLYAIFHRIEILEISILCTPGAAMKLSGPRKSVSNNNNNNNNFNKTKVHVLFDQGSLFYFMYSSDSC